VSSFDFENDIPQSLAQAAHRGTSFVPKKRAVEERTSYAQSLQADYENFRQHAVQGGTLSLLEDQFATYRQGVAQRTRAYLESSSRCLSSMITGRSNFPTERNRKRNAAADKKREDLLDFQKRARAAILRTLRPDLQPVRSSDSDAVERLQEDLESLEGTQKRMKAANAAIRKYAKEGAAAQVAALMALQFTQQEAAELLQPDFAGRIGFAGYRLQYANANIRRIRARIEEIKHVQAKPVTEIQGTVARLEDDPPANRVRLFFPSKPAQEVITTLKSGAFRWTPSLGCWQAYRNPNSIGLARRLAGSCEEVIPATENS